MNKVIMTIILFAICVSLVVGVVLPIATEVKVGGEKTFQTVKQTNTNIVTEP